MNHDSFPFPCSAHALAGIGLQDSGPNLLPPTPATVQTANTAFHKSASNPNRMATRKAIYRLAESVRLLFERYREEHLGVYRFTATTTCIDVASKRFSRFIEKVLRPILDPCEYVRVTHRHNNGLVHFHVVVGHSIALRAPRSAESKLMHEEYETDRKMCSLVPWWPISKPADDLTAEIQEKLAEIRRALAPGRNQDRRTSFCLKKDLHFLAVNGSDDDVKISSYFAHYLRDTLPKGRSPVDKGARLWNCSRSLSIALRKSLGPPATFCLVFRPDGSRDWQQVLSAHRQGLFAQEVNCADPEGWADYEKLRAKYGPRWFFKWKDVIYGRAMPYYFTEGQFVIDWGFDFSPEQLGIAISNKDYSPDRRQYRYQFEHESPSQEAWEKASLRQADVLGSRVTK
jgi:hypothetical protein